MIGGRHCGDSRRARWILRLVSVALACTAAWAGPAGAARLGPSPHPRPRVRPPFLQIAPSSGPAGTVVTIHAYCGPKATPFGLSFLIPPTGPAVPGQLQPTGEGPATIENAGPNGQAQPLAGYPAGTVLATVTVLAGLPPGVYPIALDCTAGSELTKPFTIPGQSRSGISVLNYQLALFEYLARNYLQYVYVYTGPGSTPASYVPATTSTLPPPPARVPATTTTQPPTSTTSSTTTTTTCVRTRSHPLCP